MSEAWAWVCQVAADPQAQAITCTTAVAAFVLMVLLKET